jgi:predicted aspartyl protease
MPDMGTFRIPIKIESHSPRGAVRAVDGALVDTGSEYTWIPRAILESLGIQPETELAFRVADGRRLERHLGMAIVHAGGRFAPDWVVFAEPDDTIILGAHSLEGLNFRVDPTAKRLVDAGPVTTATAA